MRLLGFVCLVVVACSHPFKAVPGKFDQQGRPLDKDGMIQINYHCPAPWQTAKR